MLRASQLKLGIIFISVFVIVWTNLNLDVAQFKGPPLMAPQQSIKYFTFGYDETFGDSLWLTAIQNFTTCEQDRGGSSISSSGARMGLNRTPSCQKGYLFYVLSLILDILPRFLYAARVGPVIDSVVVDDIDGATELFEKAMRNFPNDWVILTRAAYHYVFELEDFHRGAQLYYEAAKQGAPAWMALYASKLIDKHGRKEMAIRMIKEFMRSNDLKPSDKINFINKLKELGETE